MFVVAPVTATALADVTDDESGIASGINNALARIGGLIAIILLPLIGGMAASQADTLTTGVSLLDGYRTSMLAAAGMCLWRCGRRDRLPTAGWPRYLMDRATPREMLGPTRGTDRSPPSHQL